MGVTILAVTSLAGETTKVVADSVDSSKLGIGQSVGICK